MGSLHFLNVQNTLCMRGKPIYCSAVKSHFPNILSLSNRSPQSETLARLFLSPQTINPQTTNLTLSTPFNGVQRQVHHLHRQVRLDDSKSLTTRSSPRHSIGSTSRYGVRLYALFANYFDAFQPCS